MGTRGAAAAITVARYRLRPLRRSVRRWRAGATRLTWGVRLGPREVAGHRVELRSPRFDDAAAWREVRTRARDDFAPWWASAGESWDERHSDAAWITHVLQVRDRARAGLALPLVGVIDGVFVGECGLEWIAPHTATAELGAWMDPEWARRGISGVAGGMVIDHAVAHLGVQRFVAPIAVGNTRAGWGAHRLGLRREGVMAGYLDVGGRRLDHELWAVTAERLPAEGVAHGLAAAADRAAAARARRDVRRAAAAAPAPPRG